MAFSEESLRKFHEMCAAGLDFAEGEVYDFARCIMPNGEIYGVSDDEKCEVGKRLPDGKKVGKGDGATQMAKLKKAFIKKTGREMSAEELKKASALVDSTKDPGKSKKTK
jgi:hypothetical protein